jgi:hypothetical protein
LLAVIALGAAVASLRIITLRNYFIVTVWVLIIWMVVGAWRLRKHRVTVGPAAGASMTALMDDQRRAALEIILEERTGEKDPEDRDGNLPDLAGAKRKL